MPKKSTEHDVMEKASRAAAPVTPLSLVTDLRALGVQPGMVLNVHSALSRLGWLVGGAQSVIAALTEAVGPAGTLAMPAHSGQLSEPSNWRMPPAPEAWWPTIRAEMPAYDPQRTPTRGMGTIPETFRSYPGVLRSKHPQTSHVASGPLAAQIVADHPLDCLFGDQSPMGKLYALDATILLLGVAHDNNTMLHLAEDRADFPGKARHLEGAPIMIDGERRWQAFHPIDTDARDFARLGEAFAATGLEISGRVGAAEARFMRARDLVDFAIPWLEAERRPSSSSSSPSSGSSKI